MEISEVTAQDLPELLALMRAYCDFYHSTPSDQALLVLSRALIEDPDREGVQFLARDGDDAVGFATLFWSWETNAGGRIGVMNDLFVGPRWRGGGAAEALIDACRDRCRRRGAVRLSWQTALDNHRAQAVYDRVGATRQQWLDYSLDVQ
jgi:GNAT superfamily N-acetyltransferase